MGSPLLFFLCHAIDLLVQRTNNITELSLFRLVQRTAANLQAAVNAVQLRQELCLDAHRLYSGTELCLPVMGQDHVLKREQFLLRDRQFLRLLSNHQHTQGGVTEQLPLIGILLHQSILVQSKLPQLSNIVKFLSFSFLHFLCIFSDDISTFGKDCTNLAKSLWSGSLLRQKRRPWSSFPMTQGLQNYYIVCFCSDLSNRERIKKIAPKRINQIC